MPRPQRVSIPVGDLVLADAAGLEAGLGDVAGVQVVVLMRHHH